LRDSISAAWSNVCRRGRAEGRSGGHKAADGDPGCDGANVKGPILLAGVLMLVAAPIGAGDRIVIRVSPSVAFAPANLIVRTTVETNRANRMLEVIAESEDFYRSSEMPLDGEHAPHTTLFEFRSMPGGVYRVRALVKDASGEPLGSAQANLNVISNTGVQ
jgi:hypothetical protein